jgi:hypothetical protein
MSRLTWARIDCDLIGHPKVTRLLAGPKGPERALLYLASILDAVKRETDGHVPGTAFTRYGALSQYGKAADAAALVTAGLWDVDPDGDGWWVHDFADYQPTRTTLDAAYVRRSAGGARAVCARWMRAGKPCTCGQHEPLVGPPLGGLRAIAGPE